MDEAALRQACEELAARLMLGAKEQHELMAFARRMQAVGVRVSRGQLEHMYYAQDTKYLSIVDDHLRWCEAEAKRLEGACDE